MSRIDFTPEQTTTIGVSREDVEVRRHVEGVGGAPVDPAEAAGGEHADPGRRGDRGRRRHRRRAVAPERVRGTEVAPGQLDQVGAVQTRSSSSPVRPILGLAVEDGDRRRHGAGGADRLLQAGGDLAVAARRQAVGEDRALQRDDRPPCRQRRPHLPPAPALAPTVGVSSAHPAARSARPAEARAPRRADEVRVTSGPVDVGVRGADAAADRRAGAGRWACSVAPVVEAEPGQRTRAA